MKKALAFLLAIVTIALAGCSAKKVEAPKTEEPSPEELALMAATSEMDKRADEIKDDSGYFIMYNRDASVIGFYNMTANSGTRPGPMAHVKLSALRENERDEVHIDDKLAPGTYRCAMVGNIAVISILKDDGTVEFIARIPVPQDLWDDTLRPAFQDISCKMVVYQPSQEPPPKNGYTRDKVILYK